MILSFLPTFLQRLSDPDFFRTFFARTLWVLAGTSGVAVAFVFILNWKDAFDYSGETLAGCIVFQLFFALAAYAAVHVLILRAMALQRLEPGGMPIAAVSAVLLRTAGEAWGLAGACIGTGTGLFVWIADRRSSPLIEKTAFLFPQLKVDEASFTGGLALIAKGLLCGLLALLAAYLLAELLQRLGRSPQPETTGR